MKELLDILYDNKDENIESVKALSIMGNESAKEIIDAYVKVKTLNQSSIGTSNHDMIINIVTSYPDQSYKPDSFGEFLFGCIDVDITDLEESCRPECRNAIIRNEQNYRRCSLPVWKLEHSILTKLSEGDDDATRGLVFVVGDFHPSDLPAEPRSLDVYYLDNNVANRFIGTYHDRQPIDPSIGQLPTTKSKKVTFQLPESPSAPNTQMTSGQSNTSGTSPSAQTSPSTQMTTEQSNTSGTSSSSPESSNVLADDDEDEPSSTAKGKVQTGGIQQWIIIGALILLVGLGIYFIYRQFNKSSQSMTITETSLGNIGGYPGSYRVSPSPIRLNQI